MSDDIRLSLVRKSNRDVDRKRLRRAGSTRGEAVRSRHPHDNESAGSTICIVWGWYDTPPQIQ